MAINLTYHSIISKIERNGKTKEVSLRTKEVLRKTQDDLQGAFSWDQTVEGSEFWVYVSRRLLQLGDGYGWKD
jgi:hypothetical protein